MKLLVKSASFSTENSRTSRLSIFTVFLTIKTLSRNVSITLLQISLKPQEHRGGYWRKKPPWTILEEQFPVPRNTAASKIGNGVISLLWQLRCHCNPDHNKFSSLSNTTVVVIFPKLCLWRRSLCSNLGGIDPEKLYWATLKRHSIGYFAFVTIFIFFIHKYWGLSNRYFKNGQHIVRCSPKVTTYLDCVTFVKTPSVETCSAVVCQIIARIICRLCTSGNNLQNISCLNSVWAVWCPPKLSFYRTSRSFIP